MGLMRTALNMATRDRALDHKLYIDGAVQHQRAQIAEQYKAPEREQRARERAENEARKLHDDAVKARKIELAEQEKRGWAEWAMPPRFTGGVHPDEAILVLHHRSGKVPVLILPPVAVAQRGFPVLNGAEELVKSDRALMDNPSFMEKAKIADGLYSQVRQSYGQVLSALRDGDWWRDLCVAAGVSIVSTDDHLWTGEYAAGKEKITTHDIPRIAGVKVAADGLRLRIEPRLGDTVERWRKALPALRAGLKSEGAPAGELSVHEDASGAIVLRFNDADPLRDIGTIDHVYDPEKFRSLLGITSTGQEAWITWKGSSGMVVGGVPGSGKTASMLPVFAAMKGEVELHIFDGKSGFDLHPLRHIARTYDRVGDLDSPLETLRMLDRLRVERAEALHESIGANNFWNVDLQTRRRLGIKPVFAILDEVQTWLDQGGMSKEEKAVAEEIKRLIRTLVQKGRSAGIVVILTTQKPDATSIPTIIRDNAALKIAFKVSTPEQATTILGAQPSSAPSPTDIPMSAKGRFVMETEGQGIVLGQAGYRDPDELDTELSDAEPVEDQSVVAARLAGTSAGTPAGHADTGETPAPTGTPTAPVAPPGTTAQAAPALAGLSDAEQAAIAALLAKLRSEQAASASVHETTPSDSSASASVQEEEPDAPAPEAPAPAPQVTPVVEVPVALAEVPVPEPVTEPAPEPPVTLKPVNNTPGF